MEVIDLVLTSALASQFKWDGTLYDFLGVLDHADYESDICFLIRPSGGPHCHFYGVKIRVFFLLYHKGTLAKTK